MGNTSSSLENEQFCKPLKPYTILELGRQVKQYRESIDVITPSDLDKLMLGKLMRVVMEVSEAAEEVRNGDMTKFQEEIADAVMLLSDIIATVDFDIDQVIFDKFVQLRDKPRGKWHGKAINI